MLESSSPPCSPSCSPSSSPSSSSSSSPSSSPPMSPFLVVSVTADAFALAFVLASITAALSNAFAAAASALFSASAVAICPADSTSPPCDGCCCDSGASPLATFPLSSFALAHARSAASIRPSANSARPQHRWASAHSLSDCSALNAKRNAAVESPSVNAASLCTMKAATSEASAFGFEGSLAIGEGGNNGCTGVVAARSSSSLPPPTRCSFSSNPRVRKSFQVSLGRATVCV
mmetsp:Transcript_61508/g.137043  ORF Transcript_61508/g.137043 Transcript_61508/m.137043 type:complete len:233 (-) Transcript_61508:80-778(-)